MTVDAVMGWLGLVLVVQTGIALVLGVGMFIAWECKVIARNVTRAEKEIVWFPEADGRQPVKGPFRW